jgi:carboxypeptidase C (cathepsin A)
MEHSALAKARDSLHFGGHQFLQRTNMIGRRALTTFLGSIALALLARPDVAADESKAPEAVKPTGPNRIFQPSEVASTGAVTIGGKAVAYRAIAGTLVVHGLGWDDVAWREAAAAPSPEKDKEGLAPEASIFYTAYFKQDGRQDGSRDAGGKSRPLIFIYNGGPGSATLWLHMGAFGPRRVVVREDGHTPPAPYPVVDNAYSLLDVADLVFIDAPGAGFSRIAGKDKEKAFWGVDNDSHAFARFIQQFLNKYGRWNSPKYLFGESYGTTRSAVLANELASSFSVDLNGVILLSTILNFDLSVDSPSFNPGVDTAYVTALPTMAATAWYHNRLPGTRPAELEPFLREVEKFALSDYAAALQQGGRLEPAARQKIAERLSGYLGLPVDYLLKSDLRVSGGQFSQQLQLPGGLTTGRIDTRFSGPSLDLLSKEAQYDPMITSVGAAYVAAWNDYARSTLKFPAEDGFKIFAPVFPAWDMAHQAPGMPLPFTGQTTNVMLDLATVMKQNPNLKVLNTGGYYDLATPYFEGVYEMEHLPIPDSLRANIEYRYFPSGHMVYLNEPALAGLHDTVADFVRRTSH